MPAFYHFGPAWVSGRLLPFAVLSEIPDFQAYWPGAPHFANEAELECAKIFDFYRIPWAYEPRTFVLEEDDDGRVVEAFTPDFYLPEQDLYIEVTVMKQSLVTRNRKLRKIREPLSRRPREALLQARHRTPRPAIPTRPRL